MADNNNNNNNNGKGDEKRSAEWRSENLTNPMRNWKGLASVDEVLTGKKKE